MIVSTSKGKIQGVKEEAMISFKGIPYALPPTGKHRFKAPVPIMEWEGTLDATRLGCVAAQMLSKEAEEVGIEQGEDCLNLNISTPRIDDAKRAVVVWVHGGGFVSGWGYNEEVARAFTRKDIVVVSVNYRLGALGFLYLDEMLGEEYRGSANCGMLDVIEALRWVQEHIGRFGGDMNRITLMGHSAGAKLMASMLGAPVAKGLFHRVILQSGAVQSVRDTNTAASITKQLLDKLALAPHESERLLEFPVNVLIEVQASLVEGVRGLHTFGPVIDGIVLHQAPLESLKMLEVEQVSVLIGTSKNEAKFYMENGLNSWDESMLQKLFGHNSASVNRAYIAACRQMSASDAASLVLTEYLYGIASVRLAETLSEQGQLVWAYRFDWDQDAAQACHGAELPFVWKQTQDAPMLAEGMNQAWVSFIKDGLPKSVNLPVWPLFSIEKRYTMILNDISSVEEIAKPQVDPDFAAQVFVEF